MIKLAVHTAALNSGWRGETLMKQSVTVVQHRVHLHQLNRLLCVSSGGSDVVDIAFTMAMC